MMSGKKDGGRILEGRGWGSLLKDIEGRYYAAFADLGPGAANDFKHLIDCVEAFLDLLNDSETDFRVKLTDYGKVKSDVFEFCRYYAKWLGEPLMERLKSEIYEVLEEAIDWWGRQETYSAIEG